MTYSGYFSRNFLNNHPTAAINLCRICTKEHSITGSDYLYFILFFFNKTPLGKLRARNNLLHVTDGKFKSKEWPAITESQWWAGADSLNPWLLTFCSWYMMVPLKSLKSKHISANVSDLPFTLTQSYTSFCL